MANAVAAISEILETSQSASQVLEMNSQIINKLLTALNECTEWGQVFILDAIANYTPTDDREAQRSVGDRVNEKFERISQKIICRSVLIPYFLSLLYDQQFLNLTYSAFCVFLQHL